MPKLFPDSSLEIGKPIDPDFVFAWNYYRMARSEKNKSWLGLEKPALAHFLKDYPRDLSILELGIGAGNLTNLLLTMGFNAKNITGIDPNKYLLNKYKEEHPEIRAETSSITGLSYNFYESFDLILAHMVLNHIKTNDLEGAFIKVFRALKEKGDFLFMIPNPLEKAAKYHFDVEEDAMEVLEFAPWKGSVVYQHHSFEELEFLLKTVGFNEVKVICQPMYGDPLNNHDWKAWASNAYLSKEHSLYESLPKRILVRARKS